MLGLKELQRRKLQFVLITVVVALIGYLILMINALGLGLQSFAGSALKAFDADYLAYSSLSNLSIPRSELSADTASAIVLVPGVTAAGRIGYFTVTPGREGKQFPASLLGFEAGKPGAPTLTEGRAPNPGATEILAEQAYLDVSGFRIGDTISIPARLRTFDFTIVGAVESGRFFFQSPLYVEIADWQRLRYGGARTRDTEGNLVESPVASVVLVRGGEPASIEAAVPGLRVVDKTTAFNSIEGVRAQNQTVASLRSLGYTIGGLVIGIFFYVLTLQKIGQVGILKAIGASGRAIFLQLGLQVILIVSASLALSIPLALLSLRGIAAATPDFPLLLTSGSVVTTIILLFAVALIGALVSGRQIAKVDPIIALGQTNT